MCQKKVDDEEASFLGFKGIFESEDGDVECLFDDEEDVAEGSLESASRGSAVEVIAVFEFEENLIPVLSSIPPTMKKVKSASSKDPCLSSIERR